MEINGARVMVVGGASGMARATASGSRPEGRRSPSSTVPAPRVPRRRGDRRLLLRVRHHRLRGHRADGRRGDRSPRRARRRRERRRWRHRQEDARQARRGARPRVVPPGRRPQPGRHVQPQPAASRGDGEERAERRRRARRDHQHRSIAAFEGQIGQIAYTASKAGVAGMSLTMARDLGSFGIRVNAIAPSLFDTGLVKAAPDEMKAEARRRRRLPEAHGQPRRVRQARRGDHRQPDAQRRHHPPRRRPTLRPAMIKPNSSGLTAVIA